MHCIATVLLLNPPKILNFWTKFSQTQTLNFLMLLFSESFFFIQTLVSDAQWLLNAFFTLIFKIVLYAVEILKKTISDM